MSEDPRDEYVVGVLNRLDSKLERLLLGPLMSREERIGWVHAIRQARQELALVRRDFEPEDWLYPL